MGGGASNNVIEFKFEKIAPRSYKVASPDLASRGKIYTFRIIE